MKQPYPLQEYRRDKTFVWRVEASGVLGPGLPEIIQNAVAREILASMYERVRGLRNQQLAVPEWYAKEHQLQLASNRRVFAVLAMTYKRLKDRVEKHRPEMEARRLLLEGIVVDHDVEQPFLFASAQGDGCGCMGYRE